MSKKEYRGLDVKFVPTGGMNILSTSFCDPVSVQYYIVPGSLRECDTEVDGGGYEVGYSLNYYQVPQGTPGY